MITPHHVFEAPTAPPPATRRGLRRRDVCARKICRLAICLLCCSATTSAAVAAAPAAKVTSPPPGTPAFYQKYVDAGGIKILTSAKVPDEALLDTRRWVLTMLGRNDKIRTAMARHGASIVILADDELITDVPTMEDLPLRFPKQDWTKRRGGGGTLARGITWMDAEHVLHGPNDRFQTENNMVHEVAHAVHNIGVQSADKELHRRIDEAYAAAKARGLWEGTYAGKTVAEYWAEGTQSWFDCNRANDRDHNDVDTRAKLKKYDPTLATLLETVYGDEPNQSMKRRGEK